MQMIDIRDRLNKNAALAMQNIASGITSGQCVDFADYKARCGRLKGIQDGMDINAQVFKRLVEEDPDEGI